MAGDVLLSTDLGDRAPVLAAHLNEVMTSVPRLLPPLPGTRHGRALARTEQFVDGVVAGRRDSGGEADLVSALLAADLPDATVRGELIAFLLAAMDEPPSALEAAFYLLGRHPEAEARLHAELDSVLGGRPPALADRPRLPWLDAVLREVLRLYPPARHIDRCPVHDVEVNGEHVAAGANMVISPLVTHGEDELHERPRDFDPDRWTRAGRDGRRGTYLPFGAGVHTCIGEPLARAVMTLGLAAIAQHWRFEVDPHAPEPSPARPRSRRWWWRGESPARPRGRADLRGRLRLRAHPGGGLALRPRGDGRGRPARSARSPSGGGGREGLYALTGREHLIDERPRRLARAHALQRRGRRVARILRHLPFVRALALTGSLAADDAHETADVDLMVIVAPGRLATTFLLLGPASTLMRRRLFCPNYYLSEDCLEIEPANPYVARELVQARCLAGPITGLRRSNPWLAQAFPNAGPGDTELPGGGRLQRGVEWVLGGRLGDALERFAARVARSRLRAHYGGRVPGDVAAALSSGAALRFHGLHTDESIVARYEARRAQVAEMLAKELPSATTS